MGTQRRILGALEPRPPGVTKVAPEKKEKEKGKKREKRKKKKKKGKKEGGGQQREKIERLINITRGASFRGGFKVDAGSAPSPNRARAPDFEWAPQAKRMHQIVRIAFEN